MRLFILVTLLAGCMAETDTETGVDSLSEVVCVADSPGLSVPLSRSRDGAVVHWSLDGGCVATRFDPALGERADDIQRAIDAWAGAACSQLCLSRLVGGQPDPEDRAIYFVVDPGASVDAAVSIRFSPRTGAMTGVDVLLADPPDGDDDLGDLNWAVGRAIGIGTPEQDTNSVMRDASSLTAADIKTLCTLYGDEAICER